MQKAVAWGRGWRLPIFHDQYECPERGLCATPQISLADTANHAPSPLNSHSDDYKISVRIEQGQKLTNSRGGELAVHTWHIPEVFGRTNRVEREALDQILKLRRQARRRDFGDADPISTAKLNMLNSIDL